MPQPPDNAPWNPERHWRRLVKWGGLLAVFGAYWGDWLGLGVCCIGLLLLLLAAYSPQDGLLILGPFARYELTYIARKKRPQLWRTIYALAFFLMLFFSFQAAVPPRIINSGIISPGAMGKRISDANILFFQWFAFCTFGYVIFLAITQFSGVVAEERANKRWEILLTTDLRPREILLGKAAGRLPLLLDPILVAVPILSASTLFGGVSPTLVVYVAFACLAVAIGVAGTAFFYSVFNENPRDAMNGVFLFWLFYLVMSGFGIMLLWGLKTNPRYTAYIPEWGQYLEQPIAFVGYGNPVLAVAAELQFASIGASKEEAFGKALRKFAAFHLGLGLVFGSMACRRLRTAETWKSKKAVKLSRAKAQENITPSKAESGLPQTRKAHLGDVVERPPVTDWSLSWWERYGHLKKGQMKVVGWLEQQRKILYGFLFALGVFLLMDVFVLVNNYFIHYTNKPENLGKMLGVAVPWFATWGMLMASTMRAVQTMAREREKGTLEFLRLLPLDPREILLQKWWGCVTSETPLFITSVVVLLAGLITGYIHPASVFGYLVCMPIYVFAFCAYALIFTINPTTPGRATRNFFLITIGLCYLLVIPMSGISELMAKGMGLPPWQKSQFWMSMIPPVGVGVVLFGPQTEPKRPEVIMFVVGTLFSLGFYLALGAISWKIAVKKIETLWAKLRE